MGGRHAHAVGLALDRLSGGDSDDLEGAQSPSPLQALDGALAPSSFGIGSTGLQSASHWHR